MLKFIKSKYIPEDNSLMLIITRIHSIGGAERVVVNLANYFADFANYKVTLVVISDNKNSYYCLSTKVQLASLEMPEKNNGVYQVLVNNIKRIIKLRKLLFTIKPKIIIGFMEVPSFLACCASVRINNIITIGSIHVHPTIDNIKTNAKVNIIRSFFYKYLSAVVMLTEESKEWLCNNTKLKKIFVIPNLNSYPLPKKHPIILPSDVINTNKNTLLAVGRINNKHKGFDLLLPVFNQLLKKHHNWQLVILGEGKADQRLELEQLIHNLKLQTNVYLPGAVGNIADWYQVADIFVFPSRYEGFGCVLAEAMSYGLPAVSFNCKSGPADIITHGVNGFLVEVDDAQELIFSLDKLMSNKKLRNQFATEAIQVRERFGINKIGNQWQQLFKDLS